MKQILQAKKAIRRALENQMKGLGFSLVEVLSPTTAAYDRGDYFEAHELMEPAWMGTADLAERSLIQGLIKVAAADVHAVRGNPAGVRRNLEGARDRLRSGATGSITGVELDVVGLLAAIDERLARSTGLDTPISIDWRTR